MKKIFLWIFFICFLGIFFYFSPKLWPLTNQYFECCVSKISYPVLLMKNKIGGLMHNTLDKFKSYKQLKIDLDEYKYKNEKLLSENIELKSTNVTYQDINELVMFSKRYKHVPLSKIEEQNQKKFSQKMNQTIHQDLQNIQNGQKNFQQINQTLPQTLQYNIPQKNSFVVQVIAKHFSDEKHFFFIEGGENIGVKVDMIAVYKNCLIGRVTEIFPYYSKVTLITDANCKVAAFCKDSKVRGIHEGQCKLNETKLSYVYDSNVDLQKTIKKDDLVISSGEGLIFPRGFGLARVIECRKKDFHVDIFLQPLVDLKEIDYCCLVTRGTEYLDDKF